MLAVMLVVAMYLLPTMAALGVGSSSDPTAGWGLGYYTTVAEQVRLDHVSGIGLNSRHGSKP